MDNKLIFVSWKSKDFLTGKTRDTDYHLAVNCDGVIRTSCGMVIRSTQEQPDYSSQLEPLHLKTCSVCNNRSGEFTKKHFSGRKLIYRRSGASSSGKSHESNEEVYRNGNIKPGPEPVF